MLNVILTIDTEVSSQLPRGEADLPAAIARDIYGHTQQGDFGLDYQLKMLEGHGLRAVFFIESLFAELVDFDSLRHIVSLVQGAGQDAELHVHTEWLAHLDRLDLPTARGRSLKDYSAGEQETLIELALENLKRCGAENVRAFRAGNFGANGDTLAALQKQGIDFDSSYNQCHLSGDCALDISPVPLQPVNIGAVTEFPVSVFSDGRNRWRPAQLCACSFLEMQSFLMAAWENDWPSVVLVWHTFELIHRDKSRPDWSRPDHIVIRRFERLLEFLAANSDKFKTVGFGEAAANLTVGKSCEALKIGLHHTAWRNVEQMVRRIY